MYYDIVETDVGTFTVLCDEEAVTAVDFGAVDHPEAERKKTPVMKLAEKQLKEYGQGKRKAFDLPLNPKGTEFQKKVWNALLTIPYGETRSYKEIAVMAGSPKGFRAVGMANNRNPIPVFIPCHRVIGADGSLVGFGGGLDIKKKLLDLENHR